MSEAVIYNAVAVALYLGLMAWIVAGSIRQNRGVARDIQFEAVGTRKYGAFVIGIAIAETMLGPADAMALSQNGLKYGLIWAMFPLGAALAQFTAGTFFVKRIHEHFAGRLSVGDIFAERCGHSSRIVVGLLVTAQAVAFSGVLILAGGQVLQAFLGLPIAYGMVLTALVVGAYTTVGGIRAVIQTNTLQAAFAWSVVVLAAGAVVYLAMTSAQFSPALVFEKPGFATDHPLNVGLALFIAYFMGELLLPAYSVRALIAKDANAARNGFLLTGVLLVIWYLVITTAGSMGDLLLPEQRASGDDLILLDVVRSYLAPGSVLWYLAGAVIVAGLLALIHSTFDAFLNAGAVSFSRDVAAASTRLSDSQQGAVARVAAIVIALLGTGAAFLGDSLIGLLLVGYTIWVPSLLAPFAWILLNSPRKLAPLAFWAAVLAGGAGWYIFEYLVSTPVPGILAGFIANLVVLLLVQSVAGRTTAKA